MTDIAPYKQRFMLVLALILASGILTIWLHKNSALNLSPMLLLLSFTVGVQWLISLPSYIWKMEHFYDFTGSSTILLCSLLGLYFAPALPAPEILIGFCVLVWALRLGCFLTRRVLASGSDRRFDKLKLVYSRFVVAWTLQGLWTFIVCLPLLASLFSTKSVDWGFMHFIGFAIWIFGFTIEVIADRQKTIFSQSDCTTPFITNGLWAYSRHPNYFGEITLWLGVAIMAIPSLQEWYYLALISPVIIALLIIKVSGVPMLEESADKRWGHLPEYQQYKSNTPVLIPKLSSSN